MITPFQPTADAQDALHRLKPWHELAAVAALAALFVAFFAAAAFVHLSDHPP